MSEAPGHDPASGEETAYRGFLFADLRGYTAFVEAHGSRAAANLLDAYRELVRREVAAHAGAEIKTEGDSFYVVFPSAQRAVACGLAIVAAAARFSAEHPHRPVRVGIGINAGETVQRGEGFIGPAVNLAARVCSEARAGEVLVTATVREASRGDTDLRFTFRGNRRLKGIARPVPLYAVTPSAAPQQRWAALPVLLRGWWPAVAAIVAGLAVAAFLVRSGWLAAALSPTATPTLAPVVRSSGPSPSAPVAVGPFPSAEEAALLARLDPAIADHCKRADPDERPRLPNRPDLGSGTILIPVNAGVACTIPSTLAPSVVTYWSMKPFIDWTATEIPVAQIAGEAGRLGIPPGDCATQASAYGRWEFGGSGGRVLCRTFQGDAILKWSYDGLPVLAVAVRHDGDTKTLYEWWRDRGRFLRSS